MSRPREKMTPKRALEIVRKRREYRRAYERKLQEAYKAAKKAGLI